MKAQLFQRIMPINKLIDVGIIEVQLIDENNVPMAINIQTITGVKIYKLQRTEFGDLYVYEYNVI